MAIHDRIRKLTYDDYARIPDDGQRHEIIDGEHCVSPAPFTPHQGLSIELGSRLHLFVKGHRLGHIFTAPCDVVLSKQDVVQPDLWFVSNERAGIVTEKNIQGAPDLIVEILSEGTRHLDETVKLELYDRYGVAEYWTFDTSRKTAHVHRRTLQGLPSGRRALGRSRGRARDDSVAGARNPARRDLRMKLRGVALALLLSLALLGTAAPSSSRPSPASAQLAAILAEYEKIQLEQNPLVQVQRGLEVRKLPDYSYEGNTRDTARLRSLRERLARVDPKGLTHEEWLSREILDVQLARGIEFHDHYWTSFQVTPYSSPFLPLHQVFREFTFKTVQDRERYLDLLKQYARAMGQLRSNLETQRAKGILLPRAEIDPVVALIRSILRKPEESPFAVSSGRLEKFYPEGARGFQAQVLETVETRMKPSLEAVAAVLDSPEYRKAAPERVGVGQYPGGLEAYRYLVRLHTSLEATPEEIHKRGLDEVARLNGRLEEVRGKVGFEGDLEAFRRFLKTDPRFFVKTPEEVAERLMAPVRRAEPRIQDFFLRTPKAPYGVARLEPELEGSVTYGYYRQPAPGRPEGDYLFNGSKLGERSMLSAAALIFHELVPGHHFQISLQLENEGLSEFRKNNYPTAYVEGWAMYASGLAEEMGGYSDPYDLAGWLANDLFLSSRLVVDTGMNALGWTREQAIDYMKRNTFESETQIGTETLRYAVDIPAQALAYKMGASKIRELRARAERELGGKFDVRRFHAAVLGSGAMPLSVLEKHVDWWIGEEKKR